MRPCSEPESVGIRGIRGQNPRGSVALRGVVHDPTARRMGGVAGHAGLFGTASDLAIYCRMLLNDGAVAGRRILSPLGVARLTAPSTPGGERNVRGLGWDIDSSFSANRGELLPLGSRSHGFHRASLWIDPSTGVFVVFLSNRLHPDGKGDVTPLRAKVATVVAAIYRIDPDPGCHDERGSRFRRGWTGADQARWADADAAGDRRSAQRRLREVEGEARRSRNESHRPRA